MAMLIGTEWQKKSFGYDIVPLLVMTIEQYIHKNVKFIKLYFLSNFLFFSYSWHIVY